MLNINELFDIHQNKINKGNLFANKITALFILSILLIFSFVLETRILFNVDVQEWNIEKCNPKYLFFSGYVKRNENSTALESTQDNFVECLARYSRNSENSFEKRMIDENEKNINEINNTIKSNIKNRDIILSEKRKQQQNNEKSFALRSNIINKKNNSMMQNLQMQILEMNKTISDLKEYLHSYLTYAMMNFAVKYKKQIKFEENENITTKNCDIDNSNNCNQQKGCIYAKTGNENDESCVIKSDFFKDQAEKVNSISISVFDGNKL